MHAQRRRNTERKSQTKKRDNDKRLVDVVKAHLSPSEAIQIRGSADAAAIAATILEYVILDLVLFPYPSSCSGVWINSSMSRFHTWVVKKCLLT